MPSGSVLFVWIIAGAIGVPYFMYGKRQEKIGFLVAGICLCVYPYVVPSLGLGILVGLGLAAAPFLFDR
jgi:hypothetical protein